MVTAANSPGDVHTANWIYARGLAPCKMRLLQCRPPMATRGQSTSSQALLPFCHAAEASAYLVGGENADMAGVWLARHRPKVGGVQVEEEHELARPLIVQHLPGRRCFIWFPGRPLLRSSFPHIGVGCTAARKPVYIMLVAIIQTYCIHNRSSTKVHGEGRGPCCDIMLCTLGRSMRQGYVLAFAPPHGMSRMPACHNGTSFELAG